MATRWRVLNRRRRRALQAGPRCGTCGTRHAVLECRFNAWEKPDRHLCSVHALDDGFCCCCGLFCGGIESFDLGGFGRQPGYCDNCWDQIISDYDWDRDYDEYDYGYDDAERWASEDAFLWHSDFL
jgi:hypothetical protein